MATRSKPKPNTARDHLNNIWPAIVNTCSWAQCSTYGSRTADGTVHSHLCPLNQHKLLHPGHYDDTGLAPVTLIELLEAHLDQTACGCFGDIDTTFHAVNVPDEHGSLLLGDLQHISAAVTMRLRTEQMTAVVARFDIAGAEHDEDLDDELCSLAAAAFRMQIEYQNENIAAYTLSAEVLSDFNDQTMRMLEQLSDHIRTERTWGVDRLARRLMSTSEVSDKLPVVKDMATHRMSAIADLPGDARYLWDNYGGLRRDVTTGHGNTMFAKQLHQVLTEHPAIAEDRLWINGGLSPTVETVTGSRNHRDGEATITQNLRCAAMSVANVNGRLVLCGPALALDNPKNIKDAGPATGDWRRSADLTLALWDTGTTPDDIASLVDAIDA